MRMSITLILVMMLACQGKKQDAGKTKTDSIETETVRQQIIYLVMKKYAFNSEIMMYQIDLLKSIC